MPPHTLGDHAVIRNMEQVSLTEVRGMASVSGLWR